MSAPAYQFWTKTNFDFKTLGVQNFGPDSACFAGGRGGGKEGLEIVNLFRAGTF